MHIDRNGMGLRATRSARRDNDLTHVCTKLYAKGMRNPFRFTLRRAPGLSSATSAGRSTRRSTS